MASRYGLGKQVRPFSVGKQARPVGGGKQVRPVGGGKQLSQRNFYGGKRPRAGSDDEDEEEDEDEDGQEEEEEEEEEQDQAEEEEEGEEDEEEEFGEWHEGEEGKEEEEEDDDDDDVHDAPAPVGKVGKAMAVGIGMGKRPVGIGMGKQARPVGIGMGKQARPVGIGKGKQLQPVGIGIGKGKQVRPIGVGIGKGKQARPVGVGIGKGKQARPVGIGIGKGKQARPVGVGIGKAVGVGLGKGKQASRVVHGGKQVTQRQFYGGKRPKGKVASDDDDSEEAEESEEEADIESNDVDGDGSGTSDGSNNASDKEDEAAAVPSRPGRLRSAADMSDDAEEEEEDELDYNSADDYDDDLYKGPEDRARLAAMNEMEREMILAERGEKRDNRREDLLVRAKLKEQRERNAAAKRTSARAKAAVGSDKAAQMRDLASKREQQAQKRKEAERERLRAAAQEDEADESGGDAYTTAMPSATADSAIDADDDLNRPPISPGVTANKTFEIPAKVEELERIRLTRQKLEKWLLEPFFDRVVPGCYVRIGIGDQGGRPLYRVAEVVGVKDGFRPYMLGRAKTDKRLLLKIGNSTKAFGMTFVSNQNFEPGELSKFERASREAGAHLPTSAAITAKVEELKRYRDHVYTEEEINMMLQAKRQAGVARGNLASESARVKFSIEAAEARGETEKAAQLEKEAQAMAERLAAEKAAQEKREATAFRIRDINMRNRAFELKVSAAAGAKALAQRTGEAPSVKDPFARIENRGTNYYTIASKVEAAPAQLAAAGEESTKDGTSGEVTGTNLSVEVPESEVRTAGMGDAVSPGFQALLSTPRTAGASGGTSPGELDEASAAAAAAAAVAFGDVLPASKGVTGGLLDGAAAAAAGVAAAAGGVGRPPLVGKRVKAHMAIDLDIDLSAASLSNAAAKPRKPTLLRFRDSGASRSTTMDTTTSRRGATLSVSDYKRRMGIL